MNTASLHIKSTKLLRYPVRAMTFVFTLLTSLSGFANAWPDPLLPRAAVATAVSENMELNGLPMRIWQIHSKEPIEQTLKFYRETWAHPAAKGVPPYIENNAGKWKIISRVEKIYLITVQLDSDEKKETTGILAISQLEPPPQRVTTPDYPKLPGSTVLQELNNHDIGKDALTVVLENGYSVASNRDYYRKYYVAKGWAEIRSTQDASAVGDVLLLQKGPMETTFSFVGGEKTKIVAVIQYGSGA